MSTATLAGGFTYAAFTITDITPVVGPEIGGTTVTITGTNLDSILNEVTFGGVAATDVTVVSNTEITCITPAGTDVVDVVVTQGAESQTLESVFQYVAELPSVTSITPNTGSQVGGTEITIVGANFDVSSTVSIGGNPCTSVVVSGSTEIVCDTPAGTLGAKDVVVTSAQGETTFVNGFTYYTSALTITGTSIVASLTSGGDDISISGLNFDGSTTIEIGGTEITDSTLVSDVLITGKVPAGAEGTANVVATKGVETFQLTDYFTYVEPLILTSVSPSAGLPSGGQAITITGSGINSSAIVTIGGIPIGSNTVVNDTTVTGTTPANSTGTKDVVISQTTLVGLLSDSITNGFVYSTEGNLGPNPIRTSYDQLLYVSGGVNDELKNVQDAAGVFSPLQVSETEVDLGVSASAWDFSVYNIDLYDNGTIKVNDADNWWLTNPAFARSESLPVLSKIGIASKSGREAGGSRAQYPLFAAVDSRYCSSTNKNQIYQALGIQSYALSHPKNTQLNGNNLAANQHVEAVYLEARRYESYLGQESGFTVCVESDICNYGNEYHWSPTSTPPLNDLDSWGLSANLWLGSGCGGGKISGGNTDNAASACIVIFGNNDLSEGPERATPTYLRGIVFNEYGISPTTKEAISLAYDHRIAWYNKIPNSITPNAFITAESASNGSQFGLLFAASNKDNDVELIGFNRFSDSALCPSTNNIALGSTSYRWSQGFGVKGWKSLSDERQKHDISDLPDQVMDAWETVQFQQFKLNGHDTWSIGVIAQKVISAFESFGLNALDYDLVTCENDSYSVCYEQALALECACLRRKLCQLLP